jgi:mRNA-degrading endonuclease RelE of RelBE toxin-antitoxin system
MACCRVEVSDEARKAIRRLPGNIRQRVVRLLNELQAEPFPDNYGPSLTGRPGLEAWV